MPSSEWVERRPGFWLYALKQLEADEQRAPSGADVPNTAAEYEIAWRVEAMRPQVPARGPIGYLHATPRRAAHDTPGRCGSCGEPKEPSQQYVCEACQEAKWRTLNEVREDVSREREAL